jgi:hypothetical protein
MSTDLKGRPLWTKLSLQKRDYLVMTLSIDRGNVDEKLKLKKIEVSVRTSQITYLFFPVHARTKKMLEDSNV